MCVIVLIWRNILLCGRPVLVSCQISCCHFSCRATVQWCFVARQFLCSGPTGLTVIPT